MQCDRQMEQMLQTKSLMTLRCVRAQSHIMKIKVSLHHLKTVEPPLSLELVSPSGLIIKPVYIYFFTTKVGTTNCSDTWEISSQSYSITSVV